MPSCTRRRCSGSPGHASRSSEPMSTAPPGFWPRPKKPERGFSSISAAGIIMDDAGTPIRDADESAPTFPNHFSAYLASKAQAETVVLAANKPGLRTLALRPPALWGRGDPFSRALPQAINSGQFAFIDRGDYVFATCHVDNVLEA